MAVRKLKLDPICLAYSQNSILLHVESEAEVLLPSAKLGSLPNVQCLEALSSGEVWVCRGNSCRVECVVTIDGVDAPTPNFDSLVESSFEEVGNLEMWNQLGLSAVLHREDSSWKGKVASIALRHSELSHTSSSIRQPWSVTSDEFLIPNAIPHAEFQRLQIRFDFQTGVAAGNIPKVLRNPAEAFRSSETPSYFQRDHGFHEDPDCRLFESANAEVNQDLTELLMSCTESLTAAVNSFIPTLLSISPRELPTSCPVTSFNSAKPSLDKLIKRRPFSKEAVDILMAWVEHHPQSQRPNLQERGELALRTGLEPKQIKTWFDNRARKHEQGKHKLTTPSTNNYEKVACQHPMTESGDEMLLESDSELLADSISKNIFASTPLAQTCTSHFPFQEIAGQSALLELKPTISHSLVRTAMQLIIGCRQTSQKMPQDMQIHKLTTTPLTTLCPVMFSPGFKKSIAHNARYFPRITHSFTHFTRYAQSPTLREKLTHLTNLLPSEFLDDNTATKINGKSGSEKRLAAVIQSRLWKMMHRNVYSPSAARRAMKTSPSAAIATEGEDNYDDLLDSVDRSDEMNHLSSEDEFQSMISDEERDNSSEFDCLLSNGAGDFLRDEFDDLLGNDDEEEMLLSDSDRERFDIESERDEIWFSQSSQFEGREEDDGSSLADRDWHDEVMLLGDDCTTRSRSSFMSDDMLL